MKRTMLIACAAAAAAVPVAATSSASQTSAQTAAKNKNIVQVAQGAGDFDTLVSLVKKAGLAKTLSSGSFTVFAPTDAAFRKVPNKTLDALGKDKAKLKAVLTYHALAGRVPARKVVKLSSAKTVNGASVKIRVRDGKVYLNGSTRVTKTDIKASNGLIHVINKVLLPPS